MGGGLVNRGGAKLSKKPRSATGQVKGCRGGRMGEKINILKGEKKENNFLSSKTVLRGSTQREIQQKGVFLSNS